MYFPLPRWERVGVRVSILFPYFPRNLSCQLLAPRTMKIDVPDTVRGELVEP